MQKIILPKLYDYQKLQFDKTKEHRFSAIAGGRRVGKTYFGLLWLLYMGLRDEREGVCVWVAPTMKQSKQVGYNPFIALCERFPKGSYKLSRGQTLAVELLGQEYRFESSDNPDGLRGIKAKSALLDEAAFQREYAWTEVIRPALADLRGHGLLISTYNGFNWFWEKMQQVEQWNTATWPTQLNPTISDDEIEAMRTEMDEQAYKQEILAIPTTRQGLVFEGCFDEGNVIENLEHVPEGYRPAISIDFGWSDPCAISIYAYKICGHYAKVIKIAERHEQKQLLEDIIPRLLEQLREYGINPIGLECAVDIAGNQHTGTVGHSYIDRLRAFELFEIKYRKCEKESSINFLRAQYRNSKGEKNFKICKRCTESIRSATAYEIKKNERPYDDAKNDHFPDSDIYFMENIIRPKLSKFEQVNIKKPRRKTPVMRTCLKCRKRFWDFYEEKYCQECKTKIIMGEEERGLR